MEQSIMLFIYGTLKEPYVQRALLGREMNGTPDRLADHRKTTVKLDDATYPDLEPAAGEFVEGLCVHVDDRELHMLDTYEGREYARIEVQLESGATAWVYSTQHPH